MPSWSVKSITSVNIPEGARVVLPISLSNPVYNDPERLKALVEHYSQYQLTVLLADGLNRFNVGDEQAKKLGNEYIDTHKEVLSKVTLVRWNEWIAQRQDKVSECRKLIEEECKPSLPLHNKCLKSIKSLKNEREINNAVEYLKEELAVILAMSDEYDFHVYAGRISAAISKLYEMHANDFHLPTYIHVHVTKEKHEVLSELPVYLRGVLEHTEKLLTSEEISLRHRVQLASRMTDLIASCIPIQRQLTQTQQQKIFTPRQLTEDDKIEEQQSSVDETNLNTLTPVHG